MCGGGYEEGKGRDMSYGNDTSSLYPRRHITNAAIYTLN